MQIRTRLTLQFTLIVAGILFVAMLFIYLQFKTHLQNEFNDNLRSKANLIAAMAISRLDNPDSANEEPPQGNLSLLNYYTENISIFNAKNVRVYSFNPSQNDFSSNTLDKIRQQKELTFPHGKFGAMGLTYLSGKGQPLVVIAEGIFNPQDLQNLLRILCWVYGLLIAMVTLGGWFFAGQAIAPVNRIMNQVDDILPSDLSKRLQPHNQHDELSRLVQTFNRLLDRIHRAFNAQKSFLSNVSHELKNPLTVIISQLEVILDKERSREEYRSTLGSVLDDMKELNEVSNKLMQLSKINADGASIEFRRLRLDEMIWQAKDTVLKSHPDYHISFEVLNLPDDEDKLYVSGNEQLLKTALVNLMENGCKFSPDQNVKVRLAFTDAGAMAVEILDRGPGIPEDEMPKVFEPFYRSRKTATVKGSGIGLSLVDSIVKLHKIKLKVSNRQPNGSVFLLEFPQVQ